MKIEIFSQSVKLPSNKKFGLFFSFIFFGVSIYLNLNEQNILSYYLFITSLIFLILALFKSSFLLPLNRIWMFVGFFLGLLVRPIVMGFIFFLIFTPLGLIMRIFGRDELKLKLNSAPTYWKSREPKIITSESFKNQF